MKIEVDPMTTRVNGRVPDRPSHTPTASKRAFRRVSSLVKRATICVAVAATAVLALVATLAFHKAPAAVPPPDHSESVTLETRVREAQIAAASGKPQRLSVSEAEINSLLDSRLVASRRANGNKPGSLHRITVHFIDDRMNVHLELGFYGKDMTIDVGGRVFAQNGYLQFDPVNAAIGALPIPQASLRKAVRDAMSSPEAHRDMRLPRAVSDLRVEDGKLVVLYR
jgi:hypothetical protein